jgi:hypothetical protein
MRSFGRFPFAVVAIVVSAIGLAGAYYLGAGQEEVSTRGNPEGVAAAGVTAALEPSPSLDPAEVVTYQLTALGKSGTGEVGIRQCYEFASPLNRAATGPFARFTRMVRSPPYHVMLQAADALVGRAVVRDDRGTERATVLVTMIDAGQNIRVFRFFLSKQRESPYEGCWMTDAVREMVFESPAPPPRETMSAPAVGV